MRNTYVLNGNDYRWLVQSQETKEGRARTPVLDAARILLFIIWTFDELLVAKFQPIGYIVTRSYMFKKDCELSKIRMEDAPSRF